MTTHPKGLTVTAVQHDDSEIITAYFNELPGLVVQGSSMDDVKVKLGSLLKSFQRRLDANQDNFNIQTKCLA